MDYGSTKIIDVLRDTIDPNQRQKAEQQLGELHKIIGFAPGLLQIVMMSEVDMPVRQAGVVYLKNLITNQWVEKEVDPGTPLAFSLHEQDKAMIRDAIVDAVVMAPEVIRVQLAVCVSNIVKHDFPGKWTQIVDKVSIYLQNPDATPWFGALLCLYQLVKNYEYKNESERGQLNDAMLLLLPQVYTLCTRLLPDPSEHSTLLQKQILKIFFAFTQYTLPVPKVISREVFGQWMEIFRQVAERPVPEHTLTLDEDERADTPWWKCKKWALHILSRIFERYGSPGGVVSDYEEFARWYLKTFSAGILDVLLATLAQYRAGHYISPRVMQQALNYLTQAVGHGHCWARLKPHATAIIQEVLFPFLSYTDADEELWSSDPHEYIRVKFDIFEDFVSPVSAAQTLLHAMCKKRKNMLSKTMQFVVSVLTSPEAEAKQKDGALHMVGQVADILLKKEMYKSQMDKLICTYVFPEFSNPHGHMRARACWTLYNFSEIKFQDESILVEAIRLLLNALLHDKELPVKVEAAIAIQMFLNHQKSVVQLIEPQIREVTLELLRIIQETENDDLTNVMQKIVCTYSEQLTPIAVEICQHLANTFLSVLDSDEGTDEKAIAAMALLNTIETMLSVFEDAPPVIAQLEPICLQVVGQIFSKYVMEFYEEALSLVYDLTSKKISPDLWKVLEMIYQIFQKDGLDYFTDMMPALHNYITVDTPAFLSSQDYVLAIFNMCRSVLTSQDTGEDPECHAAKLLEVILLQCPGQVDYCIQPFIELMLERLMREIKTSELRTMCLQVVIAALYYNPQLFFQVMNNLQSKLNAQESVTAHFIKQWILDTDCFLGLHDRKLCVLGLCTLLSLPPPRPPVLSECGDKILPSLILLFDGLKRAYEAKAKEDDSSSDSDDSEDIASDELSSDEDDIDEAGQEYLERLSQKIQKKSKQQGAGAPFNITSCFVTTEEEKESDDSSDDSDDEDYEAEETTLEAYTTPLDEESSTVDEYNVFKQVLYNLQSSDPQWYELLVRNLTPEQEKSLFDIVLLADQRKAAAESKRIEQSGGYTFVPTQEVPTSFNFGGQPLGR
ncbi:hypothetical protein M8J77_013390 [Diaphorina citri]|nr:hypothetical protein M8J77_013390 [Diaphorina citri]